MERARDFYTDLVDWLNDHIDAYLAEKVDGYGRAFGQTTLPEDDLEIPLRDPTTADSDDLIVG